MTDPPPPPPPLTAAAGGSGEDGGEAAGGAAGDPLDPEGNGAVLQGLLRRLGAVSFSFPLSLSASLA